MSNKKFGFLKKYGKQKQENIGRGEKNVHKIFTNGKNYGIMIKNKKGRVLEK